MSKPTLIIFTEGHPDVDTGFIAPELNVISNYFGQIFVYPLRWENKPADLKFPVNVFFRSELAYYIKSISSIQKKMLGVRSQLFWKSVLKVKPSKCKSLLNTCGYITALRNWINKIDFDKSNTIFYSYWLTAPTLALSCMKENGEISCLVSRAHGFDLYNERGDYIINFFKPYIFKETNRLYCISENGRQYLANKYGDYCDKYTVSRLGTINRFNISTVNSDSFEIVSCSSLSRVKRIELLIGGLESFQNKFPSVKIKWEHIGGGPLQDSLYTLAEQKLQPRTFHFKGILAVSEIFDLYATKPFNCLINVSESEGLPVSIMEAQSFGIPVIATGVGGTPEIVNDENGFLLPVDPTPDEIAAAIYNVVINKEKWAKKRALSRKNWEQNFDAEKNYNAFAVDLLSLI